MRGQALYGISVAKSCCRGYNINNPIHESYIIFITKNDYMKMGLPLYHVKLVRHFKETEGGRS